MVYKMKVRYAFSSHKLKRSTPSLSTQCHSSKAKNSISIEGTLEQLRPLEEGISPLYIKVFEPTDNPGADYYFKIGLNFHSQENYSEAILLYFEALSYDRSHWPSLINIGACYLFLDKISEAINYFSKAVDLYPGKEEGYFNLGVSYLNLKDYASVKSIIKKAASAFVTLPANLNSLKQKVASKKVRKKSLDIITRPFRFRLIKRIPEFDSRSVRTNSIPPPMTPVLPKKSAKKFKFVRTKKSSFSPVYCGRPSRISTKAILSEKEADKKTHEEKSDWDLKTEEIEQKIRVIRKNIEEEHDSIKEVISVSLADIESRNLTVNELQYLVSQYKLTSENRNYIQIDKILVKLGFFSKFQQAARLSFLKVGNVQEHESGDIIFSQDEIGDKMFVIIRGSIVVERKTSNFSVILNSLYDGSQFGELALVNDSSTLDNKRTASCYATERSVMMNIYKKDYLSILLNELDQDIDAKVSFFRNLPIFVNIDSAQLIPFASNIQPVKFKHHKTILKKGEKPVGLYIMSKGYAVAYTEALTLKYKFPSEYASYRKRCPPPLPFYFNLETGHQPDRFNQEQTVKERIPYTMISPSDIFGCRALVQNDPEPAKFSIVVESDQAEVFIVTQNFIRYLNEKTIEEMRTVLRKSFDVDCPQEVDPADMDRMMKYWIGMRQELVENARKDKYIERRKSHFPFNCN